ncbi:MAG: hypothetical protein Ct9H90mP20_1220 [Candidatus Neomarinimicrobiota bacterium]|nr:MAG: hypothetical protein Ct9H90mP20_1220 [Candidatus Neomarinimicrobiota bacterium]
MILSNPILIPTYYLNHSRKQHLRVILICATTIDGFIAKDSNEITRWKKDLPLFKKQTRGYSNSGV